MTTIYGIKSCNTIKKTLTKLDELSVDYQFHDYKKQGIEQEKVVFWVERLGIDKVLNKRGTTWRNLDDEDKIKADADVSYAIELLVKNTSMIKRPIIEVGDSLLSDSTLLCGYQVEHIEAAFSSIHDK